MGRMMAFDTRYEVTTHVPSSTVAPRFPATWGMETLTTVVSRISMKVASITAMVTIQGFTGDGAESDMGSQGQCRKSAAGQSVMPESKRSLGNARSTAPP